MQTQPHTLPNWLDSATRDLPRDVQQMTREEITAHYEDAVVHYQLAGKSSQQAHLAALSDLGDPVETNQALQRTHLSPWMQFVNFVGDIAPMNPRPHQPLNFWFTLLLSILPGLIVIGSNMARSKMPIMPLWGVIVCIVLSLIGLYRQKRFPIWAYPMLGIALTTYYIPYLFLCLPIVGIITTIHLGYRQHASLFARIPLRVWLAFGAICVTFIVTSGVQAILLPEPAHLYTVNLPFILGLIWTIMAGIPLAKRNGIYAGLFIVAASFFYGEGLLDYTYSIWSTPWCDFMIRQFAFWLLLVTPVWVLCARSTFGKVTGLLFPPLVGLFIIALVNAVVRVDPELLGPLNQIILATIPDRTIPLIGIGIGLRPLSDFKFYFISRMVSVVQILSVLVFASVLYHWLRPSSTQNTQTNIAHLTESRPQPKVKLA
jgi:hypothetical protein